MDFIPLLSALVGGALASILSALLTRYIERSRNIESFRLSLIQKRVDTSLKIQTALQNVSNEFLEEVRDVSDVNIVRERFISTRRKIVSFVEEAAFTNILLYGYVSGLIYSGVLYDLDLDQKPSDFKNDLRRRLNFLLSSYSMALFRSSASFWDLDPDCGNYEVVQSWAKQDYVNWLSVGKSFHDFSFIIQSKTNKQLLTEVKKRRKHIVKGGSINNA